MGYWLAYWFADQLAVWLVWVKVWGLLAVLLWGNCGSVGLIQAQGLIIVGRMVDWMVGKIGEGRGFMWVGEMWVVKRVGCVVILFISAVENHVNKLITK